MFPNCSRGAVLRHGPPGAHRRPRFPPPRHRAGGNRREPILFEDGDQEIYLDHLAEQMRRVKVELRAYCLMPNHVHLILCPATDEGMGKALGAGWPGRRPGPSPCAHAFARVFGMIAGQMNELSRH